MKSKQPNAFVRGVTWFLLAFMTLPPSMLWALPQGEVLTHGNATFERSGNQLVIRQSTDKIITKWDSFSISEGNRTEFIQPSSTSAALNRVVGGSRSIIAGELKANGKVILINPAGVTVGPTGVVNVNSFTASTHDITDEEFLGGGELLYKGSSQETVENHGTIRASGGDAILIAKHVKNAGNIEAQNGMVALAAGTEVLVKPMGEERIFIKPSSEKGATVTQTTAGRVKAAAAEVKAAGNPYAVAINLDGIIDAGGVAPKVKVKVNAGAGGVKVAQTGKIKSRKTDGSGGAVELKGGSVALDAGSLVDASGATTGGTVKVESSKVEGGEGKTTISGTVLASGGTGAGGAIEVLGDQVALENTGILDASSQQAAGGTALVKGGNVALAAGSLVNVSGATAGGSVRVESNKLEGGAGTTTVAGTILAAGGTGKGGTLDILGDKIAVEGTALVDVSSAESDGGIIHVGGGFQGSDPLLANSTGTYIAEGAILKADGGTNQLPGSTGAPANGGSAIVWSDDWTWFEGAISARGAASGGNGGFAEVSGKQWLGYYGHADLRGFGSQFIEGVETPFENGTLLLDPSDVEIVSGLANQGVFDLTAPFEWAPNLMMSQIGWDTILANLASGSVIITTSGNNGGDGDITISAATPFGADWNTALVFLAHRDIYVNGAITNTGTGSGGGTIRMLAGWDGDDLTTSLTAAQMLNLVKRDGSVIIQSEESQFHFSNNFVFQLLTPGKDANIYVNEAISVSNAGGFGAQIELFASRNVVVDANLTTDESGGIKLVAAAGDFREGLGEVLFDPSGLGVNLVVGTGFTQNGPGTVGVSLVVMSGVRTTEYEPGRYRANLNASSGVTIRQADATADYASMTFYGFHDFAVDSFMANDAATPLVVSSNNDFAVIARDITIAEDMTLASAGQYLIAGRYFGVGGEYADSTTYALAANTTSVSLWSFLGQVSIGDNATLQATGPVKIISNMGDGVDTRAILDESVNLNFGPGTVQILGFERIEIDEPFVANSVILKANDIVLALGSEFTATTLQIQAGFFGGRGAPGLAATGSQTDTGDWQARVGIIDIQDPAMRFQVSDIILQSGMNAAGDAWSREDFLDSYELDSLSGSYFARVSLQGFGRVTLTDDTYGGNDSRFRVNGGAFSIYANSINLNSTEGIELRNTGNIQLRAGIFLANGAAATPGLGVGALSLNNGGVLGEAADRFYLRTSDAFAADPMMISSGYDETTGLRVSFQNVYFGNSAFSIHPDYIRMTRFQILGFDGTDIRTEVPNMPIHFRGGGNNDANIDQLAGSTGDIRIFTDLILGQAGDLTSRVTLNARGGGITNFDHVIQSYTHTGTFAAALALAAAKDSAVNTALYNGSSAQTHYIFQSAGKMTVNEAGNAFVSLGNQGWVPSSYASGVIAGNSALAGDIDFFARGDLRVDSISKTNAAANLTLVADANGGHYFANEADFSAGDLTPTNLGASSALDYFATNNPQIAGDSLGAVVIDSSIRYQVPAFGAISYYSGPTISSVRVRLNATGGLVSAEILDGDPAFAAFNAIADENIKLQFLLTYGAVTQAWLNNSSNWNGAGADIVANVAVGMITPGTPVGITNGSAPASTFTAMGLVSYLTNGVGGDLVGVVTGYNEVQASALNTPSYAFSYASLGFGVNSISDGLATSNLRTAYSVAGDTAIVDLSIFGNEYGNPLTNGTALNMSQQFYTFTPSAPFNLPTPTTSSLTPNSSTGWATYRPAATISMNGGDLTIAAGSRYQQTGEWADLTFRKTSPTNQGFGHPENLAQGFILSVAGDSNVLISGFRDINIMPGGGLGTDITQSPITMGTGSLSLASGRDLNLLADVTSNVASVDPTNPRFSLMAGGVIATAPGVVLGGSGAGLGAIFALAGQGAALRANTLRFEGGQGILNSGASYGNYIGGGLAGAGDLNAANYNAMITSGSRSALATSVAATGQFRLVDIDGGPTPNGLHVGNPEATYRFWNHETSTLENTVSFVGVSADTVPTTAAYTAGYLYLETQNGSIEILEDIRGRDADTNATVQLVARNGTNTDPTAGGIYYYSGVPTPGYGGTVIADRLILDADAGIGLAPLNLLTEVNTTAFRAGMNINNDVTTGDVFIAEADAMSITGGTHSNNGQIFIRTGTNLVGDSTLTVVGDTTGSYNPLFEGLLANGSGDITLQTDNNAATGTSDIMVAATVRSGSGDIALTAGQQAGTGGSVIDTIVGEIADGNTAAVSTLNAVTTANINLFAGQSIGGKGVGNFDVAFGGTLSATALSALVGDGVYLSVLGDANLNGATVALTSNRNIDVSTSSRTAGSGFAAQSGDILVNQALNSLNAGYTRLNASRDVIINQNIDRGATGDLILQARSRDVRQNAGLLTADSLLVEALNGSALGLATTLASLTFRVQDALTLTETNGLTASGSSALGSVSITSTTGNISIDDLSSYRPWEVGPSDDLNDNTNPANFAHTGANSGIRASLLAGNIALTATAGSILDISAAENNNLTAYSANLTAANDIGTGVMGAAGDLESQLQLLSTATPGGSVNIREVDAITLAQVNVTGGNFRLNTGGVIDQQALTGSFTVSGETELDTTRDTTIGNAFLHSNPGSIDLGDSEVAGLFDVLAAFGITINGNVEVLGDFQLTAPTVVHQTGDSVVGGDLQVLGTWTLNGDSITVYGSSNVVLPPGSAVNELYTVVGNTIVIEAKGGNSNFDLTTAFNQIVADGALTAGITDIVVNLEGTGSVLNPLPTNTDAILLTNAANNLFGGRVFVRTGVVDASDVTIVTANYNLVQSTAVDFDNRSLTVNAALGTNFTVPADPQFAGNPVTNLGVTWGDFNHLLGSTINLSETSNEFGVVRIRDAFDTILREDGNLDSRQSFITGNLDAESMNGDLTSGVGGTTVQVQGTTRLVAVGADADVNFNGNANFGNHSIIAAGEDIRIAAGVTVRGNGAMTFIVDENAGAAIGDGWFVNNGTIMSLHGGRDVAIYAVGGALHEVGYLAPPDQTVFGTILDGTALNLVSTVQNWSAAPYGGSSLNHKYSTSYQAGGTYHAPSWADYDPGQGLFGSPVVWFKSPLVALPPGAVVPGVTPSTIVPTLTSIAYATQAQTVFTTQAGLPTMDTFTGFERYPGDHREDYYKKKAFGIYFLRDRFAESFNSMTPNEGVANTDHFKNEDFILQSRTLVRDKNSTRFQSEYVE